MASLLFGLTSALITGIGLFGVAALAMAQRTSELGIRLALGAPRWSVIRESLRETVAVVSLGGVVGIALATAAVHVTSAFVSGLVFGLTPGDSRHIATAAAAMPVVAVAACAIPAIRATRIDPLRAIRQE